MDWMERKKKQRHKKEYLPRIVTQFSKAPVCAHFCACARHTKETKRQTQGKQKKLRHRERERKRENRQNQKERRDGRLWPPAEFLRDGCVAPEDQKVRHLYIHTLRRKEREQSCHTYFVFWRKDLSLLKAGRKREEKKASVQANMQNRHARREREAKRRRRPKRILNPVYLGSILPYVKIHILNNKYMLLS